jgi:hypothetical protein
MKNKSLNRYLLIAGAVMLGILLAPRVFNWNNSEKNFTNPFESIDTTIVEAITLFPPIKNFKSEVRLVRQGSYWNVQIKEKAVKASENTVKEVLGALSSIKPTQLVSRNQNKWFDYELDDSSSIKVVVALKGGNTKEIYIGKVNFIPVQGYGGGQSNVDGETYIRSSFSDDVFVTKGFLSFTFNRDPSSFFDGTVCLFPKNNVCSLEFKYPGDSSYILEKVGNSFSISGQIADTIKVDNFITQLANYSTTQFASESDVKGNKLAEIILAIENANPITLTYWQAQAEDYFLMTSSYNPAHTFKVMKSADWELKMKPKDFFLQ